MLKNESGRKHSTSPLPSLLLPEHQAAWSFPRDHPEFLTARWFAELGHVRQQQALLFSYLHEKEVLQSREVVIVCCLPLSVPASQFSHREDEYRVIAHCFSQDSPAFYSSLSQHRIKNILFLYPRYLFITPSFYRFFERKSNNTATSLLNRAD